MQFLIHEYVLYPWHRGTALCAMIYQDEADYDQCINDVEDDEN